jgi:hypothetical protein
LFLMGCALFSQNTGGRGVSSPQLLFGISNIQTLFRTPVCKSVIPTPQPHPPICEFRISSIVFRVSYFGLRYNPLALPALSPTAKVQPRPHCGIPNTFEVS